MGSCLAARHYYLQSENEATLYGYVPTILSWSWSWKNSWICSRIHMAAVI